MQHTQEQLEALEIVSRMLGGVMMEMDDPLGVGGVQLGTLDMIYQRLQSIQQMCNDIIQEAEENSHV